MSYEWILILAVFFFTVITLMIFCGNKIDEDLQNNLNRFRRKNYPVNDYTDGPSVTVTTTTQSVSATPVVHPPYPVDPRHPTPYSIGPNVNQIGFVATAPYPTAMAPYPPSGPYVPPNPPYPSSAPVENLPPSYYEATQNVAMEKSSPYNPNFKP